MTDAMLKITIVILCVVYVRSQEEIGDPCIVSGKPGTCKSIYECQYAKNKVINDEVKPQTCFYEGNVRIVCCPNKESLHETGALRQYFRATDDGVRKANDITCRYDGKEPMTCCRDTIDYLESRYVEPAGCPKIKNPLRNLNLTRDTEIAWQKCLDYQQYLHKCVASDEYPNEYRRQNTCDIQYIPRITGGYPAQKKEFPHMAVLGCRNGIENEEADIIWIGGGSLISEKYILTAAHVLFDPTHGRVRFALLGTVNKKDIRSGALHNIVKSTAYNEYDSTSKHHDIALLELDRKARLSEFIRPACLPVPGVGTSPPMIIAGWGETTEKGNTSDVLMATNAHHKNVQDCKNKFKQRGFTWDSDRMWCVSGAIKEGLPTDSCKGDSGGPLMSKIQDSILDCTYFVDGIVSFGPECGKNSPGVYTNVAAYMDWIVKTVWTDEYNRQKM